MDMLDGTAPLLEQAVEVTRRTAYVILGGGPPRIDRVDGLPDRGGHPAQAVADPLRAGATLADEHPAGRANGQ